MTVVNVVKYILGFLFAIAIVAGGGVATALYFMNKPTSIPPKPLFPNDKAIVRGDRTRIQGRRRTTAVSAAKRVIPPKPQVKKAATPLPAGAYTARVTWQQGLSLRAEPNSQAERVGGVGYNQEVVVLDTSDDKIWQKIRLVNGEQEGWVKARNVQRTSQDATEDAPAGRQ